MINKRNSAANSLFILGNGFDLMHNLPTRYMHFKNWVVSFLISKYGKDRFDSLKSSGKLPFRHISRNIYTTEGMNCTTQQINIFAEPDRRLEQLTIIYLLVESAADDMDWKNFEEYLGKLDFSIILKQYGYTEDTAASIREAVSSIDVYFSEWIHTLDISAFPKEDFSRLLHTDRDYAINFNYTETLEKVYGMDRSKVLYIHGRRETDTEKLKYLKNTPFGADNNALIVGYDSNKCMPNQFDSLDDSITGNLLTAHTFLVKDVHSIIYRNRDFLNSLKNKNVGKIYSLGFSFSDVDMPYIEEICKVLNDCPNHEDIVWFLSSFNKEEERAAFQKKIIEAGFDGTFSTF